MCATYQYTDGELDRAIEATVTAQADLFRERTWPLAQLAKTLIPAKRRRLAETLEQEYRGR